MPIGISEGKFINSLSMFNIEMNMKAEYLKKMSGSNKEKIRITVRFFWFTITGVFSIHSPPDHANNERMIGTKTLNGCQYE